MKKKVLLFVLFVAVVAISVYLYVYKGHRDIASENADFTITVAQLQKEFATNDSLAYKKYQDKAIQISGKLTNLEVESKAIVVDEKLFAAFFDKIPNDLREGQLITIKGRFLGYDDLVEEFKMDQIIIIE